MTTRKFDLHTHYYPPIYFDKIREIPSEFSFDKSPSGQTIITYRGARFFGVTPPMTDVAQRIADMDRVGIDVEVVSLSTPNVFFAVAQRQPEIAKLVNDAYAELIAKHRGKYKAGWDRLREARYRRQITMGLIDARWPLSPREPDTPAWESLTAMTFAPSFASSCAAMLPALPKP